MRAEFWVFSSGAIDVRDLENGVTRVINLDVLGDSQKRRIPRSMERNGR
jgi:hypothetical protein